MSTVIGIDLGIRKIAYAVWRDGELVTAGAYEAAAGKRQRELHDIAEYINAVVETDDEQLLVVIEEPLVGNNKKYSMQISQTYGAVLAALSWDDIEVLAAPVGTWKKQVVGNGHASKKDIENYLGVVNERYPALCGHDQDQYDAACVGLYGVMLSARAEGLLDGAYY